MALAIGSVHVDVVPSTRDFVSQMKDGILKDADNLGKELGEKIGGDIAKEIAKPISESVEKGVKDAKTDKSGEDSGKKAGGAFAKAFEREVKSALSSLPAVDLDVETDEAMRQIGELRGVLEGFFDEDGKFEIDLATEDGLARLAELRAELLAMRSEDNDIPIDFDIDRAIESLGKLEEQARDHGDRAGGNFADSMRSALDGALKALPNFDVPVDADTDPFLARLSDLQRQIAGLRRLELGVDLDDEQAISGIQELIAQLDAIANDVNVSVRIKDDATASATALRAFLDRILPAQQTIDYFFEFETTAAEAKLGAFATQIQREIGAAIEALPAIDLDLDSAEAEFRIDAIRRELQALSNQRIGIDIDADTALARMQEIRTRLQEVSSLAGARHDLNFNADAAITSLRSVGDALDDVEEKGRAGHAVLNRFQEIGLLITLAFTPAAAAVLGLAAAGLAVVAPIAAIAAGLNGIKAAVGPLTDDLNQMRSVVSAAFVEGLIPAVVQAGAIMPTLTTGLAGVATSLSLVATMMLGTVAQASNLSQLNTIFLQMNEAVAGLASPFGALMDNILEFADIGSAALITLGPLLDQVGVAWDHVIAALQQTGAGEAAVVALFQALTSLLTLIAPLVQLGSEMFAQLGPALAAAINGTAAVVQVLADAFGALPGPIQAILATALLLRVALALTGRSVQDLINSIAALGGRAGTSLVSPFRDGAAAVSLFRETLDESGRSTSTWSQAVQSAGASASASLTSLADRMRTAIPAAAQAAGQALQTGLVTAANTAASAFDRLPDAASRAMTAVSTAIRGAPMAALNAMESGVLRAVDGFVSGWKTAENAVVSAGSAMLSGWKSAESGLVAGASAVGAAWDNAGNLLINSAKSVMAGWVAAENGLVAGASAVGRAWDAAGNGFVNGIQAIDRGIDTVMTSMFRLNELPSVLGNAGRAASSALADGLRGIETAVQGIPARFQAMGTAIGSALSRIPQVVSSAGSLITTGLARIGTAAETASRGIAAGILRGVVGITNALGGPWGLAITAAVVGLSLFGQAQADAAAKAADFKQSITDTATSIREAGGAITENLRNQELFTIAQTSAGAGAKILDTSLRTLTNTAIDGGAAWDQMRQHLVDQVTAGVQARDSLQNLTATNIEAATATMLQGTAAQALLPQLDALNTKYKEAQALNELYRQSIEQSGNSMVLGIGAAAQLTSAFTTLSDEMATTADRATALITAMTLLTGGTLPAEVAISAMRGAMADTAKAFEEAEAAAKKAGTSILDASGRIDTTTEAGRNLVDSLTAVGQSALTAAASAFDAAGGMTNVAAASAAASQVISQQREAFVKAAEGAGLGADAANRYADQLGLIPSLVTTLLQMEGLPQVQQEMLQLQGLIRGASVGAVIPINASGDALQVLESVGIKIVSLPEGKVGVVVDDKTAPMVAGIIAAIGQQQGQVGVGANVTQANSDVTAAIAALQARKALLPVTATMEREEIDDQISQLQSTPVPLPVTTDNSAVPAGAAAAAGTVTGTPAPMAITPDGTAVPPAVDGLRTGVAGTPAQLPITAVDQGATGLLNALRSNVGQIVNMPITAVDQGVSALIGQLRASIQQQTQMPISAADQGVSALIGQLRASIQQPNVMPISAVDQGVSALIGQLRASIAQPNLMPIAVLDNASVTIGALRASIAQPNLMPISITDNATVPINGIRTLAGTEVLMPYGITDNATGPINDIRNAAAAPVHFEVIADTGAAQTAIDALKQPTSSTHTVNIVINGTIPNATGNIIPAGFATGGFAGAGSMPVGRAAIVPPNTPRLIGDRAIDDEAYIPINGSSRSRALLGITAARMGFALMPMATGGLLGRRLEDSLLAQGAPLSTQPSSPFTPTGSASAPGAVGGKGVEQRLDQMISLLAENQRTLPPITVEDRSGNPVETARATQLALRLAR